MNKLNQFTLDIGIAAHNEEGNIGHLLTTILSQKGRYFTLKNIYVSCDGCTDNTVSIVRSYIRRFPMIHLIEGPRVGKLKRIEQLYHSFSSDIILILDADVALAHDQIVDAIVRRFCEKSVGLVGGNSRPLPAHRFVGKLLNGWSQIWYEARLRYRHGHNIHNSRGCVLALRKVFAQQVCFPTTITSDSQYLYLFALQKRFAFRFAKDAIVYYRKPETLQDYLIQMRRSTPERDEFTTIFGSWINREYRVPVLYKVLAVIKTLLRHPFLTVASALFNFYVEFRYLRIVQATPASQLWKMAASTKSHISTS